MFSINYLILKMLFQKTQKLPYFISLVHIDDVLLNDTRVYHQNYGDFVWDFDHELNISLNSSAQEASIEFLKIH